MTVVQTKRMHHLPIGVDQMDLTMVRRSVITMRKAFTSAKEHSSFPMATFQIGWAHQTLGNLEFSTWKRSLQYEYLSMMIFEPCCFRIFTALSMLIFENHIQM
jgi:hypothetical protein